MAYGGLLDILQGILGQQGQGYGQGYGQGQDQGTGLLAMMQQQQQGIPNQLATDDVRAGTGILSGGYGTDRLLGAGSAPATFGTGITGGGVDDNGLPAAAPAGAGAATATAAPLAPAAGGGGLFSGLSGAGASDLFSGLSGKAGGLSQRVQNNPGTIDALATGFANIGNKNVGNPFLYGASQAADELKEQVKGEAMKAALQKLGYPADIAAAGGKIPALGTSIINSALKPKEGSYKIEERFNSQTGQPEKVVVYPDGKVEPFGGQKQPAPMSTGDQLGAESGYRKEVQNLPSYKLYTNAESVYRSMVDTSGTDSKASDLNLVYGLAKIFDPGSVVREGEQVLVKNTSSLPDSLAGALNGVVGGATLSPTTRRALIQEANSRMREYRSAYDQDTEQYKHIAKTYNLDERKIIPQFRPLPGVPAAAATAADVNAEIKRRGLGR